MKKAEIFKRRFFKPIIYKSDVSITVKEFFIKMYNEKKWFSAN